MQRLARLMLVGTAVAGAMTLPGVGSASAGGAREISLVVSNFRYCHKAPCQFDDSAYMRTPAGPVQGMDRPSKFVDAAPGDSVRWNYADELCDATACPGHEVRLENGGTGVSVGSMDAVKGASITWTIPDDAKPGTVLRYYCDIQTHWKEGLTGAFRIVSPLG